MGAETALEQIVAAAWHDALGVPPASADEDFFAAGGHSLLAAEVAARIEQVLGLEVPLGMVFDQPTVRAQAAWLATRVTVGHPRGEPWPALGGATRLAIPAEQACVLGDIARQQSTSVEAALVAMVAAAMMHGTGAASIAIGVRAAGGEIAPIAIDGAGDPSFVTLVDHARGALPRGWAAAGGFAENVSGEVAALVELASDAPDPQLASGDDARLASGDVSNTRNANFREASAHARPHVVARWLDDGALALAIAARDDTLATRLAALFAAVAATPAVALSRLLPGARPFQSVVVESPAMSPPLPLTHAQERLWFLETLSPGTTTNHIQRVYRVDGALDLAILERALHALAARHPALRTIFRAIDGEAHQLILRELPLDHVVDLVSAPLRGAARSSGAGALDESLPEVAAREDHQRPFDFDRGPLWRTRICVGPGVRYLILTIHHLIVDALSVIVWLRELAEHYHAFATGTVPRLPELGTSIAEIAVWERSAAGRARGESDVAFWLERLAGARPLELPLDFRRPRGHGTGRHEIHEMLAAERSTELRALGRSHGATLNVTLFAAAAAFLARLTGQSDIVCVIPVARREEPGREAMIGLLLNLMPVRVALTGDPSFGELIERTNRAMRDAIAHANSPFERIVAGLGLAREPGRQPLLDVIVNMVPGTELTRRGELRFTVEASINSAQPCDMVIGANTQLGGLLDLMIRCRDDLFAPITAQRMMRRFVTLVLAALESPALPLSELPIMPEDERALVTTGWNDTAMPLPEVTVHALVAEQLARAPDAIAVLPSLTRGELAQRATRLARVLTARGIAPGTPVGVAIPPGPELAVAALGVMQAGAVYVPFDTGHPAARTAELAARVAFVVEPALLGEDARATLATVGPDDPAYIVFTSGSTGQPKGVITTHRALVNQILWFRGELPWRAGEVACLRSSPTFVDSLWELFGPLADGVPLAIADSDAMRDPRLLAVLAARHRVTRMVVVPSLMRTLIELGAELPDLSLWLATSEELTPALVRTFRAARPRDRLVNLYGASETADQVASYEVHEPDPLRTPIGKPIANSRIYVVDAAGLPLPIGVAGELAVAGVGVMDGYLGAAKAPSAFVHGERVYRTGDRGRWRHDGLLDYLGRLDHVLKIRGVRVEPGEVEAALLAHPEIAAAVVTGAPGFDGETRLVAHVVTRVDPLRASRSSPLDIAALRRRLRARLPETMIPTSFVELDALPLGPTGKVDRAALPVSVQLAVASRPPQGATEQAVALAWEHLLGRPVGAEDDFFAAGGQSLVAAQLGARLAQRFGVELPLPVLFEHPTVAAQAAWLEEATRLAGETTIPRGPSDEPVPLSFSQERLWFAIQLAPNAPAPKLRSALQIDGPLDVARLETALCLVAQRQASLRTVFVDAGGTVRQRVLAQLPRDHRDVDLTGLADDARDQAIRAQLDDERDRPFDLANGPPWRTRLVRFGAEEHVLVITMHHLVTDGISLAVWREDLHELYSALGTDSSSHFGGAARSGKPDLAPELAELAASAADVARWQRRAADSAMWAASRAFWRETLAGALPLDLPLVAPRTGWSGGRGGRVRGELTEPEAAALAVLARTEQTTVFGVLFAGIGAWLHALSGSSDLTIGTIAAGRERPEVRPLVGLFLNPLPLRLDATGDPTLRELVRRAGVTARAALAHGEVPFERIVADVNPERRPFRQPLFDIVLNHHPLADPPRLGDLRVSHVRGVTAPVAPYELMIRTIVRRGITVQLDFQRDRYDEERIERWLGRLVDVLRAVATSPERRLSG